MDTRVKPEYDEGMGVAANLQRREHDVLTIRSKICCLSGLFAL